MTHQPDITRLPQALHGLQWTKPVEGAAYEDGDKYLAAVPVYDSANDPNGDWHYDLAVISFSCDECVFSIECENQPWGWTIDDVDLWVKL